METILAKYSSADLILEPFPYLIMRNVLPEELISQLQSEFPSLDTITKGCPLGDNRRFDYTVSDIRQKNDVSDLWRDFCEANVSTSFLQNFFRIFGTAILKHYPNFEKRFAPLNVFRPGVRYVDTHQTADILMDAHISINTPVLSKPSSVRAAHLDDPLKLYTGLLYLRSPEDNSYGGELELYRYRSSQIKFFGQGIDNRYVERIATVPYESNTGIFFLNTINSLHGVTPRYPTPFVRKFINFVGELKEPLYDIQKYQLPRWQRRLVMIGNLIRQKIG